MAREGGVAGLMSLPLEVRYCIFEYLSVRKSKPRKLLRYWFEKVEAKSLVHNYKWQNPGRPAPIVVYNDDDCDTERESVLNENHEDNTDDDNGKEDKEKEEQDNKGNEDKHEDAEDTDGIEDNEDEDAGKDHEDGEDHESETTRDNDSAERLSSCLTIRPNGRWRHIPHMLRLTHCPPPVELFLTSQQLNTEARNWYYDRTTLRINATGSFAHTVFWQEAMTVLFSTLEFSPLDNIRKAEVTFVWDTSYIRRDTTGRSRAILPALLRQRGKVVYQALTRALELREVVIHWYAEATNDPDAEQTNPIANTGTTPHKIMKPPILKRMSWVPSIRCLRPSRLRSTTLRPTLSPRSGVSLASAVKSSRTFIIWAWIILSELTARHNCSSHRMLACP